MRINEAIALVTPQVVLVPYRKKHVHRYHEWMKSPELREQTASEPLTLAEEYDMQAKWRLDEDKLTFIILPRLEIGAKEPCETSVAQIDALPMVGDVNIFLIRNEDIENGVEIEVEVMIAEAAYRKRGLAYAAVSTLLRYASSSEIIRDDDGSTRPATLSMFVVRIGASNLASIGLFNKLGFVVTKPANVFGEIEMRLGTDAPIPWLDAPIEFIDYPLELE